MDDSFHTQTVPLSAVKHRQHVFILILNLRNIFERNMFYYKFFATELYIMMRIFIHYKTLVLLHNICDIF